MVLLMGFAQALGFGVAFSIPVGFLITSVVSKKREKWHLPCKAASSIAFIFVAIGCSAMSGSWEDLGLFLPALAFCFWGDVLLAKSEETQRDAFFLTGLGAFLIGHIVFVAAFARLHPISWYEFVFPVLVCIFSIFISRVKDCFSIGNMLPAVAAYAFFVAWLFSKGTILASFNPSTQMLMLSVGAGFFFISDVVLMFVMFYNNHRPWHRVLNLTTYYLGMFLISASLLFY